MEGGGSVSGYEYGEYVTVLGRPGGNPQGVVVDPGFGEGMFEVFFGTLDEYDALVAAEQHEAVQARCGVFSPRELAAAPSPAVAERLEYLRGEIQAERVSYGELAELQGLVEYIAPDDVELLEWAGVPESPEPVEAGFFEVTVAELSPGQWGCQMWSVVEPSGRTGDLLHSNEGLASPAKALLHLAILVDAAERPEQALS